MSFIENHFSELSGTVTVTPARPRRREANVQQRISGVLCGLEAGHVAPLIYL